MRQSKINAVERPVVLTGPGWCDCAGRWSELTAA